jgi:hypothetical protein
LGLAGRSGESALHVGPIHDIPKRLDVVGLRCLSPALLSVGMSQQL